MSRMTKKTILNSNIYADEKATFHGFQLQSCKKHVMLQGLFGEGKNPIQLKSQWHSLYLQCGRLSLSCWNLLHQQWLQSLRGTLAMNHNIKNRVNRFVKAKFGV
jgi:hypothetical protein